MFIQVWSRLATRALSLYLITLTFLLTTGRGVARAKAIDLLDAGQLAEYSPNYCNSSELIEGAGLIKSTLGQFLGFDCSAEFFHCRWQSDGYRTYKKLCRPGLVYDTLGTQNCNYDYNVKGCAMRSFSDESCATDQFLCPLSEACVNMSQRCDGKYDCVLEEDEQNCPMCEPSFFACVVSEQCVPMDRRCNGVPDCNDGTDEMNCEECPAGGFYCRKSKQCIDASQRCDGIAQCAGGDDEVLCKAPKEQEFLCEDRNHRIPLSQLCDGIDQCPDKSDEAYCYKALESPASFSQRIKVQASFPPPNYKESVEYESREDRGTALEQKIMNTDETSEQEPLPTTTRPSATQRDVFRNFVTKTSPKLLPSSRATSAETRRPQATRTTTTTEPTRAINEESTMEERLLSHTEENYEDQTPLTTSSRIQQLEEDQSEEAASNVMFPQVSIKNPRKPLAAASSKSSFQKSKEIQFSTSKSRQIPRTEVAQPAELFPFLQKPTVQKTTLPSRSSKVIDLTSDRPIEETTYSARRTPSTRKHAKSFTIEEITVPSYGGYHSTVIEEPTSAFQVKPKTTKATGTSTSSRRSQPTSRSPLPARLSTTQRPKRPRPESSMDNDEAEILERIGAHFKPDKAGRTLSPKDLLEKIESLLSKESSILDKYEKQEPKLKRGEEYVEAHRSTKKANYRSTTGVTSRPSPKWRPSLSSGSVRVFTSRIVRPTTKIPMMTYENVQMRHSDALEEVRTTTKAQSSKYTLESVAPDTTLITKPTDVRVSRSTPKQPAHEESTSVASVASLWTQQAKLKDVSAFLMEALRTSSAATKPVSQTTTTKQPNSLSQRHSRPRKSTRLSPEGTTAQTQALSKTTALALLSNVLEGDDQYVFYDRL